MPIVDPTQGPSWRHMHLSAKMDSSMRVSGRLAGHATSRHRRLLPFSPPQFFPLVFSGSPVFLIGTFCCDTAHARGWCGAWPRRPVSVNGSLSTPLNPRRTSSCSGYFLGTGVEVSFSRNCFLLGGSTVLFSKVEVSLYRIQVKALCVRNRLPPV